MSKSVGRAFIGVVWVLVSVSLSGFGSSNPIAPENAAQVDLLTVLRGHTARIYDIAFSHDGTKLASSAYDQTVKLWNVSSRSELHSFRKSSNAAYLNSLSFSPDDRLLASAHGVWEMDAFSLVFAVPSDTAHVGFSPDGRRLAVDAMMQPIYLLDTGTWSRVRAFESLQSVAWWADDSFGFEFSPDGALLALGAQQNGVARLFDTATGGLLMSLPATEAAANVDVHDVAFTSDGALLAAGGQGASIHLFRMPSGEIARTLLVGEGTMSLDFSADGRLLAISTEGVVSLWDVESGRRLRTLPQSSAAMPVAFSDEGRLLACGHYDGTITLWGIRE